jgi:hypothetical protein
LWSRWWRGWDIPRHLYIFTRPTLDQLLTRAGFHVTRRLHFPVERFHFVESWQIRLEDAMRPCDDALRRWSKRFVVTVGVMLWPAFRLLDFTACASQIAVVAALAPNSHPHQPHLRNHTQIQGH